MKIMPEHLARGAYVYVRQSTADQLANNHESRRRQYGLADRARGLGWSDVTVIDDDLGRSGSGVSRPGFEKLLAAICEGRVGAVLSIEASRLARNGRDWHTLIEFCGLVGTIIIDEDGVYEPRRGARQSPCRTSLMPSLSHCPSNRALRKVCMSLSMLTQLENSQMKGRTLPKFLVTGSAGFVGYHLSRLLLDEGFEVIGFDAMTDYYDVSLKRRRHAMLLQSKHFNAVEARLEDVAALTEVFANHRPDVVVHLAAQAGVRYSLDNPRSYLESNLVGTFNILECAREFAVSHLLMASTSSVYGANIQMPYSEKHQTDHPLTFYAATKKSNEIMAHSYAHLWHLPVTMFRFFTVYGPWGRPDMALFKFVKGILEQTPIEIYNHGEMYRDFTYVGDLVRGIRLLIDAVPVRNDDPGSIPEWDSLSPAAPFRVVNIGNSEKVKLTDFVDAIERECGEKAIRRYLEMQKGDVPATWADATQLRNLTGYAPTTPIEEGVRHFVRWYRDYFETGGL